MVTTVIVIAVIAAFAAGGWGIWRSLGSATGAPGPDTEAWERARDAHESEVEQALLAVARPLSGLPGLRELSRSDEWQNLQQRLMAAGGLYGSSVEVFLAVQTAASVAGAAFGLVALLVDMSGMVRFMLLLFALGLPLYPYDSVRKTADKRGRAIDESLPEFIQFLRMSLTSGRNIVQALDFTSQRVDGPVSAEARNLLAVLRSRSMTTEEAFVLTAYSLGTPLSYQFMIALLKATEEGRAVKDVLRAQADAVRTAVYQQRRADSKKLPNKLTMLFFGHMMPLLFIVTLLPAGYSFANL